MKRYASLLTRTPPAAPILGEPGMTPNRAGGHGFEVTDRVLAERFAVLGTVEGSYYANARDLTVRAVDAIDRLLEGGDGPWLVGKIVEISQQGRAPRQEPAIVALALALKTAPDARTRTLAANAAPKVCRTVSTAASLVAALKALGPPAATEGRNREKPAVHGRAQRRAVAGCFSEWARNPQRLAHQLIKYKQRGGWSARDLVELAHFRSKDPEVDRLISWLYGRRVAGLPPQILAYEEMRRVAAAGGRGAVDRIAELIRDHRLPWECIPTEYGSRPTILRALFEDMPMTALVRQLGRLTAGGVFESPSGVQMAVQRLTDQERVRRARVHPMTAYVASKVYASGRSLKGDQTWTPVPEILGALTATFLAGFRAVQPTGQRIVVGVDCSGSMTSADVLGIEGFSAAEAAMVMAWVTLSTEPRATGVGFDTKAVEFDLAGVKSLAELSLRAKRLHAQLDGATDCCQPILHAADRYGDVDAFVIATDNEHWWGTQHPIEALHRYRAQWERPTRMVSVAFAATHYDLFNRQTGEMAEDDPGVLAVTGFDAAAPAIIADFLRSRDWTADTQQE